MKKKWKVPIFKFINVALCSSVLNCNHHYTNETKSVELEYMNNTFLKKEHVHRIFFANKMHGAYTYKFWPWYAKQKIFVLLLVHLFPNFVRILLFYFLFVRENLCCAKKLMIPSNFSIHFLFFLKYCQQYNKTSQKLHWIDNFIVCLDAPLLCLFLDLHKSDAYILDLDSF